ncbi:MAG TPA: serine/threonine-protein kinase [Candidatus Binatia bacterium]|jgi:serine/threonine protein kinase/WD40 repeat protein|nr:serine/threonine-protein kinase [Candidatus Binatia bacterium]
MSTNIERLEALFSRAIEFRPDERAAFLVGACGQDSALLARVRALLQAHETGEGILPEQPRQEAVGGLIAEKPGDRIGHYKLLQQIGEGGCGVVYMAEQEQPVRRRVALKVIKLGMDTKKVVARFEAERQALALMDHPNIAKVLDAGTTHTGRPYFVMELVRGVKITDYCEENDLSTAERIHLFMQACRAIQHAHQKGIIHRDIKPSNVLVTAHDGLPMPKVIDFGIAKATEGRLTDQTLFTSFEQFVGTPAYMSPEQAELRGLDVDTRTDIYSLGVLLYELLTGTTPFDAKELLSAGLDEMRRTIREKEPLRPSTRLTLELARAEPAKREKRGPKPEPNGLSAASVAPASGLQSSAGETPARLGRGWPQNENQTAEVSGASSRRLLEKKELINVLRGDLDWIVMKCLEKDRTRRYETANGLAMDLQRHLKSEPVVARPPSNLYRFQKLVRRNKLAFAAAGAVVLALVLGTTGSTWEAIRARRAERAQGRLREEAERARTGEAKQRAAAEEHLYNALLGEARAKQFSGRAGQRFESLEALSKAAVIHRSTDLSEAAVAAFGLPDLREEKRWRFPSHWAAQNVCFDTAFELYAYRTLSGFSVRRVADDQEVNFLPVKDVSDIANGLIVRRFDPRSRYLAASCLTTNGGWRCRVWDLTRRGALALDLASSAYPDFSPDGQEILVINPDDTVSVKEIESGKDLKRLRVEGKLGLLRVSPDGTRLAGLEFGGSTVRIWELASGQLITSLLSPGKLSFLAWSHDGALLATGRLDGQIEVWEAQTGRLQARLAGHEARLTALAFSQQGDLLASGSWDNTLRLWDVARGRQLVEYESQDAELHFSPDDRTLACAVEGETTKLLEVAHSTGYRRLVGPAETPRPWSADFSPDGRLVAVSTVSGIGFWDLIAGKQIGLIPTATCRSAHFQTYGGLGILGSTSDGLYRWPLEVQSTARGSFLRVGAPQILMAHQLFRYSALDRDGKKILASREVTDEPLLLDLDNPTNILKLRGHPGAQFVAFDPGGRWAATGTWKGTGVKVYDVSTGQLIRSLPARGTAFVAFSPDGHWLAAADMTVLKLWRTGSWEASPQSVAGDRVSEINPLAFSPDGRLLAAVHATYEIQLLKVPTCEPVATLRVPTVAHVGCLSFSPDGAKLAAFEWSGQVDVWDLRFIGEELMKLNLDWGLPPFPAADDAPPTGPAVLQLDAGPFSKEELAQTIPPRDPDTAANLIDLTDYYNAPLTESWHSAKAAENNLSELRRGVQKFGGVEFDVRGLIQIGVSAPNGLAYPSHVLDIPIRRQCRHLHFLHAAILAAGARPGDELGSYIFHYADGRQVELPIVTGKDMADWWTQPNEQPMSFVLAWAGSNPAARRGGHAIRLFKTIWENPFPNVPIRQFDFVSDKPTRGQPFLVAITAEP